jgi:hypothetical protein
MAEKKTTTAKPKTTQKQTPAKATQTAMFARSQGRPSGKDFSASQKYQYHKKEANKAFKQDDIVKSSNHLAAMRRAEKTLQAQAEWARKNKK